MKYFWITLSLLTALTIGCNSDTSTEDPAADDGSASVTDGGGENDTVDLPNLDETELTTTSNENTATDQANPSGDLPSFDDVAGDAVAQTPEQIQRDIIGRASAALQVQDIDKALAILEEGIEKLPDDRNLALNFVALRLQKDMQLAAGEDKEGAIASMEETQKAVTRVMGEDAELPPNIGQILQINQARRHAHANDFDKAMAALDQASELGFEQFEVVSEDPFFDNIKSNEAFKPSIEKLVAKALRLKLENFESFDFNFDLKDLEGKPIKLADFEGKIVIVDLWGTWCGPCQKVIPHLVEMQKAYKDDLAVVGITYEEHDDEAEAMAGIYQNEENRTEVIQRVSDFAKEQGINYTLAMGDLSTLQMAELRGFPTMLFIDRAGKVRLKVVGSHPREQLERYLAALKELEG